MTPEQEAAIAQFFVAVAKLEELEVIRSSRHLGDIGEFLCTSTFGTLLVPQLRQPGHDGLEGEKRIQVKFNNSPTGNNINVGRPSDYELLVVVIGPRSKLREPNHAANEFRLYRFSSEEVHLWQASGGGYYCAKARLAACKSKHSLLSNVT